MENQKNLQFNLVMIQLRLFLRRIPILLIGIMGTVIMSGALIFFINSASEWVLSSICFMSLSDYCSGCFIMYFLWDVFLFSGKKFG